MAAQVLEPAPRDFTDEKARKDLSRAHMIEVLKKGTLTKDGKRTPMLGWKDHFTQEQMESVVDYIIITFMGGRAAEKEDPHDHRHKGHDHSHVKAVDYPYGLKADAARGKTVYTANCAACHGDRGDGRGNPARVGKSKPRNFHEDAFRETANGFSLFSAITLGKGHMPMWDKKLSNQEIADVSEYVLETFVNAEMDHSQHMDHSHHDHGK
jgi:mono/diheme cytochrome c family protein